MTDDALPEDGSITRDAQSEAVGQIPRRSSVTMKEVAQRANVSPTTASLFFNGRDDVCSEATAARLLEAAAELQYEVNRGRRRSAGNRIGITHSVRSDDRRAAETASTRSTGLPVSTIPQSDARTYVLGVCIPHDSVAESAASDQPLLLYQNTFLEQVWRGISHVADVEYCRILQYPRRVREGDSIEPFLEPALVNGLIMLAANDDTRPSRLTAAGLPVVLLERFSDIPMGCGAVFTLESNMTELALTHLWQLQHRRIAHIGGPMLRERDAAGQIAKRRRDRYVAWMQSRDAYAPEYVFSFEDWTGFDEEVSAAVAAMMTLPQPPTAIFCGNDAIAVMACRAAQSLGLRIPADLSILGVDNSVYGAENKPSISSVEVPYEQVGIQAVVQLTRMIEGTSPAACRMAIAVTHLVARESTGPAPISL